MKVNSLLMKTALAAAVASVSFGATAGVLQIPKPSILATEVFGDAGIGNSGNESNDTSITLPEVQFYASVGGDLAVKQAGSNGATVKLTLLGTALFAENYQDPNTWDAQGITVMVDGKKVLPADVASVDAGTGNDNTITITLQNGSSNGGNLDGTQKLYNTSGTPSVSIQGLKVKRLKSALQSPGKSEVTVEVRANHSDANVALTADAFENTPAAAAFVSTKGVVLEKDPAAIALTDYAGGASSTRVYIQVGDAQKSFTDITETTHRDNYEAKQAHIYFGDLKIKRGVVAAGPGAGLQAGKETGTLFDFTGADTLTLNVSADAPLAAYNLELRNSGNCSDAGTSTGRFALGTVDPAEPNVVNFDVKASDVNLDAGAAWKLCGHSTITAASSDRLPQLGELNANLKVAYANIRYGVSEDVFNYGPVLRNGCQVTLFNLPNVNAGDKAMIRLSNTSDKAGQVNAYVWKEDGTAVDQDADLLATLPAHGTVTFHTNAQLGTDIEENRVYLGDVLPQFAAETSGRGRIVLQGAFPSCEALGLVRSPNGTLTNMTSTTNSSGATAGTSNTSN